MKYTVAKYTVAAVHNYIALKQWLGVKTWRFPIKASIKGRSKNIKEEVRRLKENPKNILSPLFVLFEGESLNIQ